MSAADCIREAIKVWDEAGIKDSPELKPYVEALEKLAKRQDLSNARKKRMAIQYSRQARKKQFRKTIGRVVSEEKRAEAVSSLVELARESPERAIRALNDMIEYGADNIARADRPLSLVGLRKSFEADLMTRIRPILHDKYYKRGRLASTKDGDLLRLSMEGGDPGDVNIVNDAKQLKETLRPYLQELRELGVYVDELEFWSPGSPMQGKVLKRVPEFKSFLRENLDPEYHPDVEESVEFITNSIIDPTPPEDHVLSLSREVFFKTPEARVEYMTKFGDGDIVHAMNNYVRQLSGAIAEAQVLGPDSKTSLDFIAREVGRTAAQTDPTIRFQPQNVIDRYEVAAGRNDFIQNPNTAAAFSSGKNFASGLILGSVALAQVSQDSLLAPLRNARSLGWGKGFASTIESYGSMFDSYTRQTIREDLGIQEHVSHLMTSDARIMLDSPATNIEDFSRKFAMQSMRLAGTEWVEQQQRGIQALTLSREMARNFDSAWSDLDAGTQQMLNNNAIGPKRWSQLTALGNDVLDPQTGAIKVNAIEDTQLRMSVRAFLVRETENTILRPDSTTRAFLRSGRRGTINREISGMATTFLSWPIQFVRSATIRQWKMGVPGALAAYTGLFVGAVAAEQLYAVARGQPGYVWDNENLYWRSMVRSGLLTPPGEIIIGSIMGDWRASPSLGPVADTITTAFGQIGNIGQAAFTDEPYEAASNAIKLGKTAIPNLWWLEGAAIEPAFQALMWEFDPDYMRRRERTWERERQ